MVTEPQILSSFSPRACPQCMLTCFSAGDPLLRSSTSVENPLQISPFMQSKPNFRKSQMNVSIYLQMAYENKRDWTIGQNKPNSNPIKPNFKKAQMNVNPLITKDYRKKDDFAVRKNKPNFVKGPK